MSTTRNGHPLVEALRPGGPIPAVESVCANGPKVLVQVDEGAYVDPLRVVCVRSVSVGTQGYVRVTLENGDDFDVLQHDCDLNSPDTSLAQGVIEKLHRGMNMPHR